MLIQLVQCFWKMFWMLWMNAPHCIKKKPWAAQASSPASWRACQLTPGFGGGQPDLAWSKFEASSIPPSVHPFIRLRCSRCLMKIQYTFHAEYISHGVIIFENRNRNQSRNCISLTGSHWFFCFFSMGGLAPPPHWKKWEKSVTACQANSISTSFSISIFEIRCEMYNGMPLLMTVFVSSQLLLARLQAAFAKPKKASATA